MEWRSSAANAVKARLKRLIDEKPRYCTLVMYYNPRQRSCEQAYLCLTRQSLYIVCQRFDGEPEKALPNVALILRTFPKLLGCILVDSTCVCRPFRPSALQAEARGTREQNISLTRTRQGN